MGWTGSARACRFHLLIWLSMGPDFTGHAFAYQLGLDLPGELPVWFERAEKPHTRAGHWSTAQLIAASLGTGRLPQSK